MRNEKLDLKNQNMEFQKTENENSKIKILYLLKEIIHHEQTKNNNK